MERERVKEPDAGQLTDYDRGMRHYQEWADRQKSGELLIRGDKGDYQKKSGFEQLRPCPEYREARSA